MSRAGKGAGPQAVGVTSRSEAQEHSVETRAIDKEGGSLPFPVVLAALVLVGAAVPVAIAWHFGAFGTPRNDDWTYILSAFRFARSGKLNGRFSQANLVGQLVLAVPAVRLFGYRITVLQLEVVCLGVIGLVAVYDLAKQILTPRLALFVALVVAVGPMWASLAVSFMTDMPAFALAMVCLALGARAVRSDGVNVGLLGLSLAVGLVGFTVRDFAIVAPIAVGVIAVWVTAQVPHRRMRMMVALAALFTAFVGLAALFESWRHGLPGFATVALARPSLGSLKSTANGTAQFAELLGLLAAPAVVLARPQSVWRSARARAPRASIVVSVVTALGLGAEVFRQRHTAFLLGPGNYVSPNGTLRTFTIGGSRPDLLPRSVQGLIAAVAVASVTVFAVALVVPVINGVARIRQRTVGRTGSPALLIVALAAFGFWMSCVALFPFEFQPVDRYLFPLVPLIGILVLRLGWPHGANTRRVQVAGCVALLLLGVIGVIFAANSASFDGTSWRVASDALTVAKVPKQVDAGLVWNSYHAGTQGPRSARTACVRVGMEPSSGAGEAGVVTSRAVWGPLGTQVWMVARQVRPC